MYLAMKLHFTNSNFDYFVSGGKTNAKEQTYQQRNDFYFFETVARKYKKEEIQDLLLASFILSEDPTKVWYAELANGIQNVLTNSPLNEGKKAVVKMMAGGYDVQATNAKLDELIANPVVMLSFTK